MLIVLTGSYNIFLWFFIFLLYKWNVYGRKLVDLRKESQWEFLNTFFSVSEGVMFMQVYTFVLFKEKITTFYIKQNCLIIIYRWCCMAYIAICSLICWLVWIAIQFVDGLDAGCTMFFLPSFFSFLLIILCELLECFTFFL